MESEDLAEDEIDRHLVGWQRFCDEISSLVQTSQTRMAGADRSFSLFFVERLQLAAMHLSTVLDILGRSELLEFCQSVDSLLGAVRRLITEWEVQMERLDIQQEASAYRLPVVHRRRRGRPEFHITRDQLTFLRNLSFTWTGVASLLSVSRMTIYRRRRAYGLLTEGENVPSDLELADLLRGIRADTPDLGQTLLLGRLRSMGYRVTRKRLREMVQLQDPLSTALRMPGGLTSRMKYSVAGPNSLWHIGEQCCSIRQ